MFSNFRHREIMAVLFNLIKDTHKLNPERNGCAVVIIDKNTGKEVFHEFIGEMIPGGSAQIKYWYHATEKAMRLFDNLTKGHVTSAESANMKTNYPGAVLCGDYIVSISGQNMWLDEAMSAHLGSEMDWIHAEVIEYVISQPNERFNELALVA